MSRSSWIHNRFSVLVSWANKWIILGSPFISCFGLPLFFFLFYTTFFLLLPTSFLFYSQLRKVSFFFFSICFLRSISMSRFSTPSLVLEKASHSHSQSQLFSLIQNLTQIPPAAYYMHSVNNKWLKWWWWIHPQRI